MKQNFIKRKVVIGKKRGKLLGFPTANLNLYKKDNLKTGVYAVYVEIKGKNLPGVAHVGTSKTFREKKSKIEIYIFNYDQDLYNQIIKVIFLKRLRKTKRFKNKKELTIQIRRDCQMAKRYLKLTNNL